jgi:hypothetical protein
MTTVKPYVAARIAASQRRAREGTCPKCGRPVLTGPDHDQVAHLATVDAAPIEPKWETRALAAGLAVYDLDGGALCYREPWHRSVTRWPIHVWHVCR